MDIVDAVNSVAKRVLEQVPYIQSEEATKLAMINPFIRDVLDYDTTDLTQVQPEYTADVGIKQGEKVDYALIHEGEPLILIEAKVTGTPLDKTEPSQLSVISRHWPRHDSGSIPTGSNTFFSLTSTTRM